SPLSCPPLFSLRRELPMPPPPFTVLHRTAAQHLPRDRVRSPHCCRVTVFDLLPAIASRRRVRLPAGSRVSMSDLLPVVTSSWLCSYGNKSVSGDEIGTVKPMVRRRRRQVKEGVVGKLEMVFGGFES
ncbi:hypothetical protein PIB30_052988, partial [Stylosanthes scabra]|nr:hypothetical protein [Stylosanthes scabra]